ncbi:hypothetical protein F5Y15DRAFT_363480 [Xylariaceae sp. FL0016]|nr:hypothetical protein F5Y15DRAFT_363480 [Xylariaceae sp. FL0016]
MSATRVAAWRPSHSILNRACKRQPFRICTQMRFPAHSVSQCHSSEAALCLKFLQRRHQSSSSSDKKGEQHKPPAPSTKLLLRALRQSLSLRPLFSAFRGQNLKKLFRQSPEELALAIIILCGVAGVCAYVTYAYFNYFQSTQFTRFPPDIAKSLRRALYYSNYAPDDRLALKYYKLALEQCAAAGIDSFSDEVMGVKIQLAAWLEKIGSYKNSIEVLESLLRDNKKWVEKMEESARNGLIDSNGAYAGAQKSTPREASQDESSGEQQQPENLWAKRTRVLGRSVGISVKLGELYADEHVLQSDQAGERLVWAVETVLKELQRRQKEGVKVNEGDWMSPEEIGGALEALANFYETKSQHYLAAPLYLQAISLSPPKSCHTAVLMNNLAISLAQQPVQTPLDGTQPLPLRNPTEQATQVPTRAALLSSARAWALQAQGTADSVKGEDRTEECDEACAVALYNLGNIAEMAGNTEEAKRKFEESLALSKRIAFEPGMVESSEGIKRISATSGTSS